jgi:dipeptidyl aminopeptidase/acylaminoacyl peptidase
MLFSRTNSLCLAACLLAGASVPAVAAGVESKVVISAPIPTEHFFRKPEFSELIMSPDGKYIAALRPIDGRQKLVVIDLANKTSSVAAGAASYDIGAVAWINNHRLRYSVYEADAGLGEQRGGGLFLVDRDGKNPHTVQAVAREIKAGTVVYRPMGFLATVPEPESDDIFVVASERDAKNVDVYRYNTLTGKKVLQTFDAPARTRGWVLDRAGVPRVAVASVDGRTLVWYRDGAGAPWRQLANVNEDEQSGFKPEAFDFDNKTLYVLARPGGADKQALYKYDFEHNRVDPTPVFADPNVDVEGGLLFSRKRGKLLGVQVQSDKLRTTWFDPALRDLQASIDAALPGKINQLGNAVSGQTGLTLVYSYSDRDPGSYYLYDDAKKDLQFLLSPREWIDPELMAESRPLRYRARDGLEIPAYLTLPNRTSGKNLPLVVYVHGGPWVHGETWGWHDDAQFLAARGYAVLQPEYRGSTGYGWQHYRKSWKQWGLSMQDDITDGVNYLVAQGIVDPKRVCIAGASYGGYATMMGLVKDPDLYQCGVNFVGVTDIATYLSITWSDYAGSDSIKYSGPRLVGDLDKDAEQIKRTSPAQNGDKITKPVLMAYGSADRRVPVVHGEKMREALKGRVPVEWVVYDGEGHGWNKTSNNVDFWDRVDRFLGKAIGSK